MKTYDAVRKRIVQLCDQYNISLNYLATCSGISRSTLKSIMYGNSKNPGIVTIKKLCDGIDITLPEFFDTDYFRSLDQEIE